MALGLVSPGILVREIDRTVGAVDASFSVTGAFAGPFAQGPVEDPQLLISESDLIRTFGLPSMEDNHYEYWWSASNFLGYGGSLQLVRCDGDNLKNSNVGVASTSINLKIKNFDEFQETHTNATSWFFASKNPGSWANDLKICVIDSFADQTIGITTTSLAGVGATVGYGVTVTLSGNIAANGTVVSLDGSYLKAIIVGVNTDAVNGNSTIDVKILGRVSAGGTFTEEEYKENSKYEIKVGNSLTFVNGGTDSAPTNVGSVVTASTAVDWYDQQTLGLSNTTVFWKNIADKPKSSQYALDRSARNDQIHVVVVDDKGKITGVSGNILEKNLFLSKAADSKDQNILVYYKDWLARNSANIYAGKSLASAANAIHGINPACTGFEEGTFTPVGLSDGDYGLESQGVTFNGIGSVNFSLVGGKDYSTGSAGIADEGGFEVQLDDLMPSYSLFEQESQFDVDFLIMGPGLDSLETSQAKAIRLIDIATQRKDCIAVISPYRGSVVNRSSIEDARDAVLEFFAPLTSSSYAVFDSGYKYTYDRFNNQFIYLPLNPDTAGLMVRTELTVYPWYSPAGVQRGNINNIIKLAYNPPKSHRDALYVNRINPVIFNQGGGFILFGDKTALSYSSAFDRINVRRLFLVIEKAIERAARTQLFEFNDSITRSAFLNIVTPYLRDVQAKRGITDFLVVCDATNNTADVIDRNEFVADIYIKPARSINFIGLTFVATRTGVSFGEVVGTV
jgi:hypothetical protein